MKSNKFITWPVTGPFHVNTRTVHRFLKFLKARKNLTKIGRKNRGNSKFWSCKKFFLPGAASRKFQDLYNPIYFSHDYGNDASMY